MRLRVIKSLALTAFLLLMPSLVMGQEKIVFQSERDGNSEIYVMNADGTNQLRLTTNSSFDAEPAFSPGGEKIAFMSTRDGNAEMLHHACRWHVANKADQQPRH